MRKQVAVVVVVFQYKGFWGLLWHPEIMVNPVLPKELAELLKI